MTDPERYATPGAVESAITAAARKAFAADASLSIQERIRLEYLHRFLSRVFSDADDSDWMLKGGTGMLARVASARTTTDVDLFRRSRSLDAALDDLRRLAAVDLGDFFRFDYIGYSNAVEGNQQTYTEGYQVSFDVYIGAKKKNSFHVDLVVLGTTQDVDAKKLRRALDVETRARSLAVPDVFEVPASWGARYAKLATKVPACADYRTVELASGLMRSFIDPMLRGETSGLTHRHIGIERKMRQAH